MNRVMPQAGNRAGRIHGFSQYKNNRYSGCQLSSLTQFIFLYQEIQYQVRQFFLQKLDSLLYLYLTTSALKLYLNLQNSVPTISAVLSLLWALFYPNCVCVCACVCVAHKNFFNLKILYINLMEIVIRSLLQDKCQFIS